MTDVQRTYPPHTNPDNATPTVPRGVPDDMRAVAHDRYGGPEVLAVTTVATPTPGTGQVLIRVEAASLNPLDWHLMTGTPFVMRLMFGIRRPKQQVRGADVAGTIVAVGADVAELTIGDRVLGVADGSFAEYTVAKASSLVRIPEGVTPADAAALPIAGVTALQALRDHAGVEAGDRVLINGAAGGVGTFAVQIAVAMGAEVTAVCSGRNAEMVAGLGAHRVVDYTTEDWVDGTQYDAIIDNVGNRSLGDCVRSLVEGGRFVMISGPKQNRWIDPFRRLLAGKLRFVRSGRTFVYFTATATSAELGALTEYVTAGTVRPVIDRRVDLDGVPAAMEYLATGHARAKIVVEVA